MFQEYILKKLAITQIHPFPPFSSAVRSRITRFLSRSSLYKLNETAEGTNMHLCYTNTFFQNVKIL